MMGDAAAQHLDETEVWELCSERLREELPSEQYDKWIRPLRGRLDGDRFVIEAPNRYVRDAVAREYLERIAELVPGVDHRAAAQHLCVAVGGEERQPGAPLRAEARPGRGEQPEWAEWVDGCNQSLNRAYTFDTFVEGKSNDTAKAAACQVAENPGRSYNPLLLYGGVGLGKTHLMHAVGNDIRALNPQAKVLCLYSERFTNDMVRGIRTGTVHDILQRYREVDVLLIDDIQFFAGKVRTQEEFFHVFNAVVERGSQVVLTCDRYPSEIDGLEERLISRFVGGLTREIVPPDLETRAAILQCKGEVAGFDISNDVAFHIAERIRSNVRELEGALKRVFASARFAESEVTMSLVRRVLGDLFAIQSRRITIDNIQRVVADYYNMRHTDMLSARRTRAIARPRQVAMCLAKELTNHSLPEIGARFGGRDHTTVLYACDKIAQLRRSNADIAEDYKNLSRRLSH